MDLSSRRDEIVSILHQQIRPQLLAHGGDISLSSIDDDRVRVRVSGACQCCPSLSSTIEDTVQETLRQNLGIFTLSVEVDKSVSEDLIAEALRLIRK